MTQPPLRPDDLAVVERIFRAVSEEHRARVVLERKGRDKEFFFQNWFTSVLENQGIAFDEPQRNAYPDYRLVHAPVGVELKGLELPGREATFDCNSQPPRGMHNGRTVFYIFGRYESTEQRELSLVDLCMFHGDLLDPHGWYRHQNRSFWGFGAFGDIQIRDRKMYVARTPYSILSGIKSQCTLILPSVYAAPGLCHVGGFVRREADHMITGYEFDMLSNTLTTKTRPNPNAGHEYAFSVYTVDRPSRDLSIGLLDNSED